MKISDSKYNFTTTLFWDTRIENIDTQTNAPYIVQRVLEYGEMNDWLQMKELYGIPKIAQIAQGLRTLDPKALSFICAVSNTKKEQYRCYITRQSAQKLWLY